MTRLSNKSASNRNNGNKSASSRNNNNKPVFRKNNGNSEINGLGIDRNDMKHIKKSGKLSKSGKLKSKKMSKSWNLAKLRKKLSKSENSTNFNAIKAEPKFLTFDAKTIFNHLRLAFTEALILWHFDPKYHI